MFFRRVVIVVVDACGVGELPDAAEYGDVGAATVPNVAKSVGGLVMPTCQRLGLGNIAAITGVPPESEPLAGFGKMAEKSQGKDSTTGHWEIAGVVLPRPFPVFPEGFPDQLVRRFEQAAGVKTIGNKTASGTEIIKELGEAHLKTGALILYTSADSVFQLAAHEELHPRDELYEICRIARDLLTGEYAVGRVIARPFVGSPGNFIRTAGRRDFSLAPPTETLIEKLSQKGVGTLAIGKIYDLYAGCGFDNKISAANNDEVMSALVETVCNDTGHGLVMSNCVDFDMLWGHRNDEVGFARALEAFDRKLAALLDVLRQDDLLIITADHGCDPTLKSSTDHTREYVPLLVYGPRARRGVNLGTRRSFADIACTICEAFDVSHDFPGASFYSDIVEQEQRLYG